MPGFCRIELRTRDVAVAKTFYGRLLGVDLDIVPLPEAAAARGAPSHWLGHLPTADVEATLAAFVARGADRLGPTRSTDGGLVAVLRDPGGAVVALSSGTGVPPSVVVHHHLETGDLARASAAYAALFGWALGDPVVDATFARTPFAFAAGEPHNGSMCSIEGRAGVHPHWLFHFRVPVLDDAIATVRDHGGLVLTPIVLASGERLAVCDDPLGAAFALRAPS